MAYFTINLYMSVLFVKKKYFCKILMSLNVIRFIVSQYHLYIYSDHYLHSLLTFYYDDHRLISVTRAL